MSETSSTDNKPKSDMWKRRIGSFWTKEGTVSGEKFLSGELNLMNITGKPDRIRVILIKNSKKRMEKHPDWELFLSKREMVKDIELENSIGEENLPDLSSL